jgi:hypothetical protein
VSVKRQLEASVMLERLGAAILTGAEAVEAFDPDREAEKMRAQNELAFARLRELLEWIRSIKPEGKIQ